MVSSTHEHHDWVRRRKFTAPVTTASIHADWDQRGFNIEQVHTPGHESFTREYTDKDMLLVVAQGELECLVGNDMLRLQEGDELFVPESVPLKAENISNKEAISFIGEM